MLSELCIPNFDTVVNKYNIAFNPLWATLTPHSNRPLYRSTVIGTLAVDGWAVYIWYSEEGIRRGRNPPRPLLTVPNVTAHPSTASVPITVLRYNGLLLCGVNVPTKG